MSPHELRLNALGFRTACFDNVVVMAPWEIDGTEFKRLYAQVPAHSPISQVSYFNLYCIAKQCLNVEGVFMECGVFRGGSASFFANIIGPRKVLHLFDTFEGMPETGEHDTLHVKGDFDDTSIEEARQTIGHPDTTVFHKGRIPDTFSGFAPDGIAFAHVDVDIYQSVLDCCEFIYPRMSIGGIIVFDDYGHQSCLGATEAVNLYFQDKRSVPLPQFSGQCVVVKV